MSDLLNRKPAEWTAHEGTTWVCGACGKHGPQRDTIGDESCFLNASLCWTDSLVFGADGRVVQAKSCEPLRATDVRCKERP